MLGTVWGNHTVSATDMDTLQRIDPLENMQVVNPRVIAVSAVPRTYTGTDLSE